MAATFASTLLGFAREVVSARYYGTRWEMDTFLAAATIPTILFGVFNGALVSALVPTFSEYLAHRKEDEAWRLASTVLNILAIVLTVCAHRRLVCGAVVRAADRPRVPGAADGRRDSDDALADAEHYRGELCAACSRRCSTRTIASAPTAMIGVAVNVVTIATVLVLQPAHRHLRARARYDAGT